MYASYHEAPSNVFICCIAWNVAQTKLAVKYSIKSLNHVAQGTGGKTRLTMKYNKSHVCKPYKMHQRKVY